MEYAAPVPYWALNDNQMAELRRERDELRQFLRHEATAGRTLRPASINARSRLGELERRIKLSEDARQQQAIVQNVAPQPRRREGRSEPEFMEPVPYWLEPGGAMAANHEESPADRWARQWEELHPGERAFVTGG